MKTRKVLSIVLCFATLFSVLACCLMGTASAKTYAAFETKVKLDFDGTTEQYGIPLLRGYSSSYVSDVLSNDEAHKGYLKTTDRGGGTMFVGIDGTVGAPGSQYGKSEDTATREAAKAQMLLLKPGKTYRISLDYRFINGHLDIERTIDYRFFVDPTGEEAGTNYQKVSECADIDKVIGSRTVTTTDGNSDWQHYSCTFTIRHEINPVYFGLRYYKGETNTAEANYDIEMNVDNILVEEYKEDITAGTVAGKVNDMEDESILGSNNAQVSEAVFTDGGNDHGKVLKVTAKAGEYPHLPRQTIKDLEIKKNHRYFISFDAKADMETQLNASIAQASAPGDTRAFLAAPRRDCENLNNLTGLVYFVGNTATQNYTEFKVTTDWQHYGVYLDLNEDSPLYKKITVSPGATPQYTNITATTWNDTVNFFFGAASTTGYFDNIQVFDVTDVEFDLNDGIEDIYDTAEYSMRAKSDTASAGIRFKGYIPTETAEAASEIGFVVTPSVLAATNENWYKVDNKDAITAKYNKGEYYEKQGDNTGYQVLITGLSTADGKTAYEMPFAAALYAKDTAGNYTYYYIGQASYNEILATYTLYDIEAPTK